MNFIKQKKDLDLNHIVDSSKDCIKYIKSSKEKKFTSHLYGDSIIRSDFKNYLISILFNTNNIEKTVSTLKKFLEKTAHPEKIQFCIKIDNDDTTFVDSFLKEISKFEFNFIILSSPRGRGFIDLWQWINFLFKVSSKYSKFVMNISDEMYVNQKGWDNNLEKYISFEDDNIFRLRTSVYRNRNYNDLWECGYAPDTTAIYTRKYLSIQSNFSPCFGPDNGQQIVAFYLSKINYPRHTQFLRDKVINDITFSGQGTNIGLSQQQLILRKNINHLLWINIFSYKNQIKFFKRARKIQLEIIKFKFPSIKIKELNNKYVITFTEKVNLEESKKNIIFLSKKIPRIKLFLYNILRYDFFKYNTGYDMNKFSSIALSIYFLLFKKFPDHKKNFLEEKNTRLDSLIDIEKKIYNISYGTLEFFDFRLSFIPYLEDLHTKYLKIRFNTNSPIILDFYTMVLTRTYLIIINLLIFLLLINKNILSFLLFYLRFLVLIVFWGINLLYSLLAIWRFPKNLGLSRYLFDRFFIVNFRKKSFTFINNDDQSKSFIVKGD